MTFERALLRATHNMAAECRLNNTSSDETVAAAPRHWRAVDIHWGVGHGYG
jgi:hypothetical protein